MGMKFLNKKGWHTGSLRNIENVWKAEQKHDAEQKKLEELRKQIREESEKAEFRQLQEQAGLIPRQERLEFLYESGLAVGKGSSSFKALESLPKTEAETAPAASSSTADKQQAVPGSLFEEKPQSANDAWRKLHSDPLLMIRQREQEAIARVKNNPVQMAMIRKSVESKKAKKEKKHKTKKHRKKSKHSASENDSDSEGAVEKQRDSRHRESRSERPHRKASNYSNDESSEGDHRRTKNHDSESKDPRPNNIPHPRNGQSDRSNKVSRDSNEESIERNAHRNKEHRDPRPTSRLRSRYDESRDDQRRKRAHDSDEEDSRRKKYEKRENDVKNNNSYRDSKRNTYLPERHTESRHENRSTFTTSSDKPPRSESNNKQRNPVKISEEERAAKLKEMQMDAERHEEQRWKRIKKADESDAKEAVKDNASLGRNFLDAAQKSVYGAEKGGSSTIEESVRRRSHYLQGRSAATESNAFRR